MRDSDENEHKTNEATLLSGSMNRIGMVYFRESRNGVRGKKYPCKKHIDKPKKKLNMQTSDTPHYTHTYNSVDVFCINCICVHNKLNKHHYNRFQSEYNGVK